MLQNSSASWIESNKKLITDEIADLYINTNEETEELLADLLDAVVEFVSKINCPLCSEDVSKVKEITNRIAEIKLS